MFPPMSFVRRFMMNPEVAENRAENRKQSMLNVLREYQRDGYIDNEEGFTSEEILSLLSGPVALGGRNGKEEESEDVRRQWEDHNANTDVSPYVHAENLTQHQKKVSEIQFVLNQLVEEGLLEIEEERYKITEEKWENLKFPSTNKIEREGVEGGEGSDI